MEEVWSNLLQYALETVIKVLLPVVLSAAVVWINEQIKVARTKLSADQLAFATMLINELVMAAEQSGLIGAIENIGSEKKAFVIEHLRTQLLARGITLDLELLDALIEAAVNKAFGQIDFDPNFDSPLPPTVSFG